MDVLNTVLPYLMLAGLVAVIAVAVAAAKRLVAIADQIAKVDRGIALLTDRISAVETDLSRARITQEAAFAEHLRQVRADVKAVELQLGDNRENPEAIETAIRLVREGLESDEIITRTGLSQEVVESIVLFHGLR